LIVSTRGKGPGAAKSLLSDKFELHSRAVIETFAIG
jgi:hypothetical protein